MPRRLLEDTCETAHAIIAGELDTDLDFIVQAAQARKKMMFRKGSLATVSGGSLDGKTVTVLKVNQKTVIVGVGTTKIVGAGTPWEYKEWSEGEWVISPRMLTSIA